MELEMGPLRFAIVGAGRMGCAVGRALEARGLEVVAASCTTPAGCDRASKLLNAPTFDDLVAACIDADVIVLTIPDHAFLDVVSKMAARLDEWSSGGERIIHTSGCVPLTMLEPLRAAGLDVLAVHPLQTFTESSDPEAFHGVGAAVTAPDKATATFGHSFAHALDMIPFDIDDERKPLYHAASSFAASFTATLHGLMGDLAHCAGISDTVSRPAFCRLARTVIDHIENDGVMIAQTGPIVRGDIGVVDAHLTAIAQNAPAALPIYRDLATLTIDQAVTAGRIDASIATDLRASVGSVR